MSRFAAIYKEYRNAKDVTRTRLYLEALQEALPKVQEVIVLDQSSKGMVPLINIAASTAIRTAPPVPAPQPISSASNPVPANEGAK